MRDLLVGNKVANGFSYDTAIGVDHDTGGGNAMNRTGMAISDTSP